VWKREMAVIPCGRSGINLRIEEVTPGLTAQDPMIGMFGPVFE